uniref:Uncharacterized protein n=1 Tax=Rhizophora mucronata TaxID=61149 RepID=A0A2P2PI60_RHIMU
MEKKSETIILRAGIVF